MTNQIPTLTSYDAGRDMIFEILEADARNLVLHWARNEPSYACTSKGAKALGTWPTSATFKNDSSGKGLAEVWMDSLKGTQHKTTSLDMIKPEFGYPTDRQLPILRISGIWASSIDLKVVGSGNVAAGFTLNKEVYADDTKWSSYQNSLLAGTSGYGWCLAIGGDLIVARVQESLVAQLVEFNNKPQAKIKITKATASWGEKGIVIKGEGHETNKCGWDIDFEFTAAVTFLMGPGGVVYMKLIGVNTVLKGPWDLIQKLVCDVVTSPASIAALVGSVVVSVVLPPAWSIPFGAATKIGSSIKLHYDLEDFMENLEKGFPGIGGLWEFGQSSFSLASSEAYAKVTGLQVEKAGLRLFGTLSNPLHAPPKLKVTDTEVMILESPKTACSPSDPPEFPPVQIGISNEGASTMWLCDARLDPATNIKIDAPNSMWVTAEKVAGQKLEGLPEAFLGTADPWGPTNPLIVELSYHGGVNSNEETTLRLLTNEPLSWPNEIPVKAVVTGKPVLQFDKYPVEILKANTKDGTGRKTLIGFCEEVSLPDQPPAVSFRIYNIGEGPLFLCSVMIDDPNKVFTLEAEGAPKDYVRGYNDQYVIGPSGWVQFGIRFFPKAANVDYNAEVKVQSNAGNPSLPVHGKVQTLPASVESPIGIDREIIRHKVDLLRELICLELEGFSLSGIRDTIFKLPISPEDEMHVAVVRTCSPNLDMEVFVDDPSGETYGHDYSRSKRRTITMEFPPSGGGPSGVEGDYHLRYGNLDPGEAAPETQISGWAVKKTSEQPLEFQANSIVAAGGWVYAVGERGIQVVDWRDEVGGEVLTPIEVGPLSTLALSQQFLVGAGEDLLVVFSLESPDRPERRCNANLPSPARSLAMAQDNIYVLSDDHVSLYRLDDSVLVEVGRLDLPWQADHIGVIGQVIYVAGDEVLGVLVETYGQLELVHRTPRISPIEYLIPSTQSIMLSSHAGTDVYQIEENCRLRQIGNYRGRHWSAGFAADWEIRRLYRTGSNSSLEMWKLEPMRLDRSRFSDLLELRYRPHR